MQKPTYAYDILTTFRNRTIHNKSTHPNTANTTLNTTPKRQTDPEYAVYKNSNVDRSIIKRNDEPTIYIFGDSHANANFTGLKIPNKTVRILHQNSITMHRIGRDEKIINFWHSYNSPENIFILDYGEVDARCHVKRQMNAGRDMDDILTELVEKYFKTIQSQITVYKKIIVCSIVPTMSIDDYHRFNGPVEHAYGYVGTDEERILFTKILNQKLSDHCSTLPNYIYFDFFDHYANPNGTLTFELSDKICHISDNQHILETVVPLLE